jgi:uncharacterized protein
MKLALRVAEPSLRRSPVGQETAEGAGEEGAPAWVDLLLVWSVGRPRTVAFAVLALTLLAVAGLPWLELRLDGRSLIPAHQPELAASDEAARRFHLRDTVVVGVSAPAGVFAPAPLALLRDVGRELEGLPGVVTGSVTSLATLPRLIIEGDRIAPTPLLAGGDEVTAVTAARVAREARASGLLDDVLMARDGGAAAVYAEVHEEADRYQLLEQVELRLARLEQPGATLALSGTALAQAVLGRGAALDLARLVPLALGVLALALVLLFRHPAPALVSLAEIGTSLLITTGLMGWRGEAVFVTTLVLPVILLVIGVSDDVYALNHYFRRAAAAPNLPPAVLVRQSFASVAKPILLTALTTIGGLLSLVATDLEPQRVFGLYGALAIALSTLMTFTLVPALLVWWRPRVLVPSTGAAGPSVAGRFLVALERFGARRVLAVALALGLVASLALLRLRIEDNWVRNLPPTSEIARGDAALNQVLAGTTRVELEVASTHPEGFREPAELVRLARFGDALAALPDVGAVANLFDDLVRAESAFAGRDYTERRAALVAGREQLASAAVEQALLMLATLRRSPLAERLEDSGRRARLTVFVRDASFSKIDRLLAVAQRESRGLTVRAFGDGWISYVAVVLLVVGQIQSVALALVINVLLLLLLFRSWRATVLALVPICLAVVLVFACLALSGTPLGIANSMFAAVALGIGVDYSIHLVADHRRLQPSGHGPREALFGAFEATGPAIAKSAVAITLGLSVLALSQVLPNRELGLLVCLSLSACALMTLLLVPALVLAKRPVE